MTIDIDRFWKLLSQSRLLDPNTLQRVSEEFNAPTTEVVQGNGKNSGISADAIAGKLVEQKLVSSYHAEILLSGHAGPFHFGNYVVTKRHSKGPMEGGFSALHRTSQLPVLLQFYGAQNPEGLEVWNQIEALANRVGRLQHPNLARVFETIVLPQHRMVVSQDGTGTPLCEKVPKKSRLPWKDACVILLQATKGLQQVHQLGIVHNAVSPRTIWMHRGGLAQLRMGVIPDRNFEYPSPDEGQLESRFDYLAPEVLQDNPKLSKQSDIYSLACTLVRLISGKTVFQQQDLKKKIQQHQSASPPSLEKYEIPDELDSLIHSMLAKRPTDRPQSTKEVIESLTKILGGKPNIKIPPSLSRSTNPQLDRYLSLLEKWDLEKSDLEGAPGKVDIAVEDQMATGGETVSADERIEAAKQSAAKRKKAKWMMPVAIATSLLVVSGLVGTIAMLADRVTTPVAKKENEENKKKDARESTTDPAIDESSDIEAILSGSQTLVQQLIEDDGKSLWESPTIGKPVTLSFLPSAPRLLFHLKPAKLMELGDGANAIQALGPAFKQNLKSLENQIGLELIDIQQLTISLHTTEQFQYDPFFVVELPAAADHARLLQIWQGPTETELESGPTIYTADNGYAFHLVPDTTAAEKSKRFVYGPRELVEEVVLEKGITVMSGSMARMVDWLDDDRHFSMIFLRNALFNDEGQWLMSGPMSDFNHGLGMFLDDNVRGGLVSVHIDRGSYLEFILDRNVDLKASELRETVDNRLRESREAITQFISSIPANPYWDKVRQRFAIMLADLYRNLRVDVEYGQVTGNCWLPPMAVHNLIASSEMVMAFSSGVAATADPATVRKVPQSLDELLNAKRDLSVTTNPDLNILLSNIRNEVVDDWGSLPFELEIKIIANDLSAEGITQNQRPGDFEMQQTSLAEILTEIMVRCNPDRNISGPNDPACKLVWVVADHPDKPGQPAVLVTTRAAAAQKSYTLPVAFQTE